MSVIDAVKTAGRLSSVIQLKYLFISTDSTYDASAFLLDQHRHKFIPDGFLKSTLNKLNCPEKPKLPKNGTSSLYEQAYSATYSSTGITEDCAYSEKIL